MLDVVIAAANRTSLNIAAQAVIATVPAAVAGAPAVSPPIKLVRVVVNTAGGTAGTINDCTTTGAAAAGNLVLTIPTTATAGTVFTMEWPFFAGLCVTPGTSGVLSISWSG
jgi:hypothetical protein